jgi:predicted deacetylase
MPPPDPPQQAVAVAIHDVAPATLPECVELMAMLDEIGASPISLLVVPQFHRGAPVEGDDAFTAAMNARRARGDELILHGLFHVDDGPRPRDVRGYLERRVATRSEGEFAVLDEHDAALRIAQGVEVFARLRWPLAGFVPPAWLLGAGARAALAHCSHPFEYVTVRTGIWHLPAWRFEPTANLWYSPDTPLRRAISRLAVAHESRRARALPLLRASLHPQDVRGKGVVAHWRALIGAALVARAPVTKGEWVRSVRLRRALPRGAPPPANAADESAAAAQPAPEAS